MMYDQVKATEQSPAQREKASAKLLREAAKRLREMAHRYLQEAEKLEGYAGVPHIEEMAKN